MCKISKLCRSILFKVFKDVKKGELLSWLSKELFLEETVLKYKKSDRSFTRNRKLSFQSLSLLIIQKSARALSLKLNDFSDYLGSFSSVSASAFSQARQNLSYSLFQDLSNKYSDLFYESTKSIKRYKGHRLVAIDGSKIRLPDNLQIREDFGDSYRRNQHQEGSYAAALCSLAYDVQNGMIIDGLLEHSKSSERKLASSHLKRCREGDIFLLDRGYPSYALFSEIISMGGDFVCRCSSNAFKVVEEFIADDTRYDQIVDLYPRYPLKRDVKLGKLPWQMRVRLVKVVLDNQETEVIITSLISKKKYPRSEFKKLYFMRWKVETRYDILKNRLCLENFTGKNTEVVRQDFYSTLLISNIEADLTRNANKELLNKEGNKYKQKVNKTVSFATIKKYIFDLLYVPKLNLDEAIEKIEIVFLTNTIPIRDNRTVERRTTLCRSNNFLKYRKKIAF